MKRFLYGHATHPDWRIALALAAAQIEAQRGAPGNAAAPTLGWVYLTDHFVAHADALLAEATRRWPGVHWVGASGVAIAAGGVEYVDEPALALMLAELAPQHFRVFSGARRLSGFAAHTANVHADPSSHDLAELIADMSARTASGYLFGGLASGRTRAVHIADGVLAGGLSGVAFDAGVALVSRVTQGCQPVGPQRSVSAAERNVVTALDGEPALDCLLKDLKLEGVEPRAALSKLRQILVGLGDPEHGGGSLLSTRGRRPPDFGNEPGVGGASFGSVPGRPVQGGRPSRGGRAQREPFDYGAPGRGSREDRATRSAFDRIAHRGAFGADTRVRHLIGIDPGRRGVAIADSVEPGTQLTFCTRNADAARRDLMRICAELREEVEPDALPDALALALRHSAGASVQQPSSAAHGIAGAVYVSCSGRGGAHFGAPSAELAIVRHALGDVPLVGFFAAGEIARRHLYGYTGVLTVFAT